MEIRPGGQNNLLSKYQNLTFVTQNFNFLIKRTAPLYPSEFSLSKSCPRALLANIKMKTRPSGQNYLPSKYRNFRFWTHIFEFF